MGKPDSNRKGAVTDFHKRMTRGTKIDSRIVAEQTSAESLRQASHVSPLLLQLVPLFLFVVMGIFHVDGLIARRQSPPSRRYCGPTDDGNLLLTDPDGNPVDYPRQRMDG